jgi:hypothetical protein
MGNNHTPKSVWIGKAYDEGYYPFIWRKKPTVVKRPDGQAGLWVRDLSTKAGLIRLKWLRRYRLMKD